MREHTYLCRICATGKVNTLDGVRWSTTYHLPDGRELVLARTPPCVVGDKTAARLQLHAKFIDQVTA